MTFLPISLENRSHQERAASNSCPNMAASLHLCHSLPALHSCPRPFSSLLLRDVSLTSLRYCHHPFSWVFPLGWVPHPAVFSQHGSQHNPFKPEVTSQPSFLERDIKGSRKLASTPTHLILCPTAFLLAYVNPDTRATPQTSQACLYLKACVCAVTLFLDNSSPHPQGFTPSFRTLLLSGLYSSVTWTERPFRPASLFPVSVPSVY